MIEDHICAVERIDEIVRLLQHLTIDDYVDNVGLDARLHLIDVGLYDVLAELERLRGDLEEDLPEKQDREPNEIKPLDKPDAMETTVCLLNSAIDLLKPKAGMDEADKQDKELEAAKKEE